MKSKEMFVMLVFTVLIAVFLIPIFFPNNSIAWILLGLYSILILGIIIFQKKCLETQLGTQLELAYFPREYMSDREDTQRPQPPYSLLKKGKQGIQEWNDWRRMHPNVKIDLRSYPFHEGDDLSDADLSKADLTGADLSRTTLTNADLTHAKVEAAKLNQAILMNAKLIDANISVAELVEADLTGANLTEADLSGADLTKAKVTKEQLSRVSSLYYTIMADGSRHY